MFQPAGGTKGVIHGELQRDLPGGSSEQAPGVMVLCLCCLLQSAICQWELLSSFFHFIPGVICNGNSEVPFLFAAAVL